MNKIEVELLPHTPFLKKDGTFDKESAINYSAKLAGECYESDGWAKLKNEEIENTKKRVGHTLNLEHATPFEHIGIGFEARNIPKILAMVLNNERQNTTSEKSARYTELDNNDDPNVTDKEIVLYYKWLEIFKVIIKDKYGYIHNDGKVKKLAQENARYLVSVFSGTKMIHTLPWIQLNRVVSFMEKYMNKPNKTEFDQKLIESFKEFINILDGLNILDERAMSNRKDRELSLFSGREVEEYFGDTYSTNYKGTFAQLAQAHRHRTIEYDMQLLDDKSYFIPPILQDEPLLVEEWLEDIKSVAYANPQGELISINEKGTYDKFILKAKERLCSSAQLEIAMQTRETLLKYKKALEKSNHPLASDILKYSKGARCTFRDYDCAVDCRFKEGKTLVRKI